MMRSLFSGVSGLRIHQTKMDVIANNISNVNTVGFKSSRVTFNEIFSQNIQGASAPNAETGRGGTNPMQIGLGAGISSINQLMTNGAAQRTDRSWDLMLEGSGFFIVGDATGNYFTRAGAMDLDQDWNIVLSGSGLRVMGWDAVADPNNPGQYIIQRAPVQPISITTAKRNMPASSTTLVENEGNLNASANANLPSTIEFYDSIGNRYTMDTSFVFDTTTNQWTYAIIDVAYPDGNKNAGIPATITPGTGTNPTTINFIAQTTPPIVPSAVNVKTLQFDTHGYPTTATSGPLGLQITSTPGVLSPNASFGNANNILTVGFTALTQQNMSSTAKANRKDGNTPGTLTDFSIGTDGIITGIYSNGEKRPLGQIPVANFANPEGLQRVGGNLFISTANSGNFDGLGVEVQSTGRGMRSGTLEMSNVDLAAEFTEMITTQRGFQANSRIISTSDDMLQELVNIKR